MTNALKVRKLAITAFVAVVMAFVFCKLFTVQAHAAGLLDETIDTAHEFSKYPIDNYQLDFYVDSSWDWLPWNWLDGIGKTAQYAIYLFTNFLWTLNLYISNAVGYLIQQAYDLDFISSAASEIGKNIQLIAGVSASGKIVRRSRISRRLWLQTTSRTVRQNARLYKISRKHGVHRPCRKDWTKKPLVRSSNSGKLEKSRANSGAPKAEVSENDEKGGNGRCYGHRTADCFTSVDVSDYRFG